MAPMGEGFRPFRSVVTLARHVATAVDALGQTDWRVLAPNSLPARIRRKSLSGSGYDTVSVEAIVTTVADLDIGKRRPASFADLIDRWIYVFTAGLILVTVLVGFIPDSIAKIEGVAAGERPPFPLILHVHAVLMGAWVMLLLAQTTLQATNQQAFHRQLGMTAFVLAPALVIVGFLLVPTMRLEVANAILNGPPETAEALRPRFEFQLNIMLVQLRIGILFALLTAIALLVRRQDSGLHRRLMILGVAAALPPALDRMLWLPSTLPSNPLTTDLYPLVIIAPMFFWDLYRQKKIHKAYWIFAALSFAVAIPTHLLWNTPWWRETALRLLGISGI